MPLSFLSLKFRNENHSASKRGNSQHLPGSQSSGEPAHLTMFLSAAFPALAPGLGSSSGFGKATITGDFPPVPRGGASELDGDPLCRTLGTPPLAGGCQPGIQPGFQLVEALASPSQHPARSRWAEHGADKPDFERKGFPGAGLSPKAYQQALLLSLLCAAWGLTRWLLKPPAGWGPPTPLAPLCALQSTPPRPPPFHPFIYLLSCQQQEQIGQILFLPFPTV